MKIALLTAVYPPYAAGMAQTAAHHTEMLRQAGHEVSVFTPFVEHEEKKIYRLPSLLRFGNAAYISSLSLLESFKPEIIVLEYPFINCTAALKKFHTAHPEVVIKIYYHMDLRATGLKGWLFQKYTQKTLSFFKQEKFSIAASSLDYFSSSDARMAGITEGVSLPFGVDDTVFTLGTSGLLYERCGIEREEKLALFVGALDSAHAFKGLPILLAALSQTDRLHLAVIGKGNLLETYKKQAHELNIGDRVHFLGFVSDEELPHMYQSADVMVLPSTARSEAFGLVLVEAQLSGTPVIASDLPGVSGVVDPETGTVCTSDDVSTLARALVQISKKTGPNAGARKFAQKFSIRATTSAFVTWATTISGGEN